MHAGTDRWRIGLNIFTVHWEMTFSTDSWKTSWNCIILITGTLGLGTSLSLICNVANGHSCVVIRQSVRTRDQGFTIKVFTTSSVKFVTVICVIVDKSSKKQTDNFDSRAGLLFYSRTQVIASKAIKITKATGKNFFKGSRYRNPVEMLLSSLPVVFGNLSELILFSFLFYVSITMRRSIIFPLNKIFRAFSGFSKEKKVKGSLVRGTSECLVIAIAQFRYIKIITWLRGLGE